MSYTPASAYVDTDGDTMTGPLDSTLYGSGGGGNAPNIRLTRTQAPELQFNRSGASSADFHKWKQYVSGLGTDSSPTDSAMTFAAISDNEADAYTAIRMYRDGRMLIGADPTAPLQVATKQYVDNAAAVTDIGGIAQLSNASVPSAVAGTTHIAISGTPVMWGGVTTSGSVLWVPRSGIYEVSVHGAFGSNGSGTVRALWAWLSNGNGVASGWGAIGQVIPAITNTSGLGGMMSASGYTRITAGLGIRAMCRQDCGANLAITGTLTVRYVRD